MQLWVYLLGCWRWDVLGIRRRRCERNGAFERIRTNKVPVETRLLGRHVKLQLWYMKDTDLRSFYHKSRGDVMGLATAARPKPHTSQLPSMKSSPKATMSNRHLCSTESFRECLLKHKKARHENRPVCKSGNGR